MVDNEKTTKEYQIKKEFFWEIDEKEHDAYYEKLCKIMERLGVDFKIQNKIWGYEVGELGGCFVEALETNEKAICMGTGWFDYYNVLAIVCMAHELGHWFDVVSNFNGDTVAYHKILGTLETEVRAWEFGIDFLHEIDFKYWDELNMFMEECLGSYYNNGFEVFMQDYRAGYNAGILRDFDQAKNDIMARCYFGKASQTC
ncbi:hypothetical protein P9695_14865 [Weizmannia sp. CD-2023]|uniref:hypothetical protein n=1 Tax=Heyndrickxia TaxID=2837504 RepID=UPI002E1BB289|nr:hypothetical protein [Weizmannia sp. CD-2023]MED4899779.1 hypothetical protein [Weizmannia sp. CD-2023]